MGSAGGPTTGQRPTAPRPKSGAVAKPAQQTPAGPVNADGEDYSGPMLPKDFVPPRPIPDIMSEASIKELLTPEAEKVLFQELQKLKFTSVLTSGDFSEENKKVLDKTARYYVHQMTQRKYYFPLPPPAPAPGSPPAAPPKKPATTIIDLRERLARDANNSGSRMRNNDAAQARKFREYYMKQVVARLEELLDGHFHVRNNAVILMGELVVDGDEPFTDAIKPLLKVLTDKDQPDSIKIHAARGIGRIALKGKPNAQTKLDIGLALVGELQRKDAHYWYQWRVAEALGMLDSVLDQAQKPFIAQSLGEVVIDDTRHCLVRAEAARSLGRIPHKPDINVSLVAFEVARFAQNLSDKYNQNPTNPEWKYCFERVYLAFKPQDQAGVDRQDGLLTKVDKGPLAKHKPIVNEAYALTLPLFRHVFDPKSNGVAFPAKLTEPLDDWLQKKRPEDNRVAPTLTPLVAAQQPTSPQ